MTDKKARPGPWTDTENAGCCALFFRMQHKAAAGQAYNKAEMIREERGEECRANPGGHLGKPLSQRSRPSIEMKLMNLSAVMESLGRPELSMSEHGYRAMPNYQANLKTMAVAVLAVRDAAVAGEFDQVQA